MFRIVDRVVEAGHDPRRFAEDLLERLRDLIILDAVPDAAGAILGDHPADELERMRQQAAHFGAAELSRAADIVNAGLTEMRGATAPRLQLELICARVLLPAADDADPRRRGPARPARAAGRHRRRTGRVGGSVPRTPAAPPARRSRRRPAAAAAPAAAALAAAAAGPRRRPAPVAAGRPRSRSPSGTGQPPAAPTPAAAPAEPAAAPVEPAAAGAVDLVDRAAAVAGGAHRGGRAQAAAPGPCSARTPRSRASRTGGSRSASARPACGTRFLGRSDHQDYVREALIEVLGVDWKVDAIVDPSTAPTEAAAAAPPAPARPAAAPSGRAAAEAAVAAEAAPTGVPDVEATPSADDEDADDDALTHQDLLARELGAKVIGEYDAS